MTMMSDVLKTFVCHELVTVEPRFKDITYKNKPGYKDMTRRSQILPYVVFE